MIHNLKTKPEYFNSVAKRLKRAELRKNDRDFKVGDLINLQEFFDGDYSGLELLTEIIHIADVNEYARGYLLLSIKLCSEQNAKGGE